MISNFSGKLTWSIEWEVTVVKEINDDFDTYGFVDRFIQLSNKIEKQIIIYLAIAMFLLLCFQCLLQLDSVRSVISKVDRLEGVPYSEQYKEEKFYHSNSRFVP